MKRNFLYSLGLCLVCLQAGAAVLPPEKLLPKETVVLITVPDSAKSWSGFTNSAYGRLWNDPSMKAFKDKLISKCQSELIGPMEREMGLKFADYQGLAQGQLTFALLQNEAKDGSPFSPLLLVDSKDRADQLKKKLADVKKKWIDSGKTAKTEEIRGIPFTTFVASRSELSNSLSKVLGPLKSADSNGDDEEDAQNETNSTPQKIEIILGQVDSLLIVGESSKAIEKVLNRQSGGLIPALEEDPTFRADYDARLRGASGYVWVNLKALLKDLMHQEDDEDGSANPFAMNAQKILAGVGITDLKTAAVIWKDMPEGFMTQFFVGIPEASRRGIFKILTVEPKEAAPPTFVPANVIEFVRWRLDLPQTWTGLEQMLAEINPTTKGIISFVFDSAGKAKDPNYNLKSELLESLGSDIIWYQKPPKDKSKEVSALILVGSPKPEKLAAAVKVAISALAPMATIKESDFQGRTICTVTSGQNEGSATRFAANGGYLAISTDPAMLEEFLRGNEGVKPLAETAGIKEAAQKVGGMNTGLFGYTDQREQMKLVFKMLKDSENRGNLLNNAALKGRSGSHDDWADFDLLPDFESVAKYFYYTVSAATFNGDGFAMTYFAPNPPQAKP